MSGLRRFLSSVPRDAAADLCDVAGAFLRRLRATGNRAVPGIRRPAASVRDKPAHELRVILRFSVLDPDRPRLSPPPSLGPAHGGWPGRVRLPPRAPRLAEVRRHGGRLPSRTG